MPRRMSCSLTVDTVERRIKTVTRRSLTTWRTVRPGDRLTLVEKAMGLPKGTRQRVLAEVEVIDVRIEPLDAITLEDVAAEGFGPSSSTVEGYRGWTPAEFVAFWLDSHGYKAGADTSVTVRRIEWRYLP